MSEPSFAQRRDSVRAELQAQRIEVQARLGPAAGRAGRYPRSVTMRVLAQRPQLVMALVQKLGGPRVARSVPLVLALAAAMALAPALARAVADPAPESAA